MNKNSKIRSLFTQRKFRYGTAATLITVAVIALVILLNVTVGALEDRFGLAIDASALKASRLSDQTVEILNDLNEDVRIYTVYQPTTSSEIRIQVEEMLRAYAAKSSHVTWDNINPVSDPLRVNALSGGKSMAEGALIVTNADESRVKAINMSEYYYTQTSVLTNTDVTVFSAESKITSGIRYVTHDDAGRVFFLQGHREIDPNTYCRRLTDALDSNGYLVDTINLVTSEEKLTKGDVLIVVDPQVDMTADEYRILRDWLEDGGRMFMGVAWNIDMSNMNHFVELLEYYHLGFEDVSAVEESKNSTGNWIWGQLSNLVPNLDEEHPITAELEQPVVIPYSRPLKTVDMRESGTYYTDLLTTSSAATTYYATGETVVGKRAVAMALQQNADVPEDETRMVIIGSDIICTDTLANQSRNIDFCVSAVRWLINEDTSAVYVRSNVVDTSYLSIGTQDLWIVTALVVVVIPLLVAVIGLVVWIRRRRL